MGLPPGAEEQAEHKEEAGWPCSPGRQRSVSNMILNGKNKSTQATACVQRKPGEPVPVEPSIYNKEGDPGSDGEEEPMTKVEDAVLPDLDPGSAERATHESVDDADLVNPSSHDEQQAPLLEPPDPQETGPFRDEGPPVGSSGAPGGGGGGELPPLAQRQTICLPRAGLPVFNAVPTDWAGFRRGFQALADGQYPDAESLNRCGS